LQRPADPALISAFAATLKQWQAGRPCGENTRPTMVNGTLRAVMPACPENVVAYRAPVSLEACQLDPGGPRSFSAPRDGFYRRAPARWKNAASWFALCGTSPYIGAETGPERPMRVILEIILIVINLYWWVLLAMIIMSWLIAFNVVNTRNQFVASIWRVLNQLTEPVLRPIRRVMPNLQGIDISPIILFLGLYALQRVIEIYLLPRAF
jgi:YggT family protein